MSQEMRISGKGFHGELSHLFSEVKIDCRACQPSCSVYISPVLLKFSPLHFWITPVAEHSAFNEAGKHPPHTATADQSWENTATRGFGPRLLPPFVCEYINICKDSHVSCWFMFHWWNTTGILQPKELFFDSFDYWPNSMECLYIQRWARSQCCRTGSLLYTLAR